MRRATFAAVLDFRILGPFEVRDGEDVLHLGGSKQRSVLAILVLRPNTVVSSNRLVQELWGDAPPDDAAMALQAHVSRLRKALPGGPDLLAKQAPGYILRIAPGQLDLERFEELVAEGRRAQESGDAAPAAELLRSALALWRGRPLADLEDEPFAREATAHLEDAWLEALGARVDADLALARHAELIPESRRTDTCSTSGVGRPTAVSGSPMFRPKARWSSFVRKMLMTTSPPRSLRPAIA